MPRKENTKAKTWERDRRKRMNTYFKTLADLLPPHQEGRKRNKVDILIHASKYIKDLHSRTEELFSANASEAHKEELVRLKKLVTQLLSRTQLLSTLLKEAGISVPAEPALEKISPLKWSNKINVEDMEKYFNKGEERKDSEKKREKSTDFKVPCKRKPVTSSQSSSKKLEECNNVSKNANNSIENQENRVNGINNKNDDAETINSISEVRTKETDCRPNESSTDIASSDAVTKTKNIKPNSTVQKVDTQKKVRRKSKRKDNKKAVASCINNSVTNLATNTLILSGGKLMPLVTPMTSLTSNIIVNTQHQPANPIILSNTQQNQMIVMQPLTNRVQNSVVSVCNQAVINTVQKVTLNTVPSIRTKMVVDSQNWASNVKNIIKATKIGGRKGILPKGKEVTKTTMTYKVPIPAVHKEKLDRPKENSGRKDSEAKNKVNKNQGKCAKAQPAGEAVEEKVEKETVGRSDDASPSQKNPLKRNLCNETTINEEPEEKKRKADVNNEEDGKSTQTPAAKVSDFAATCKSIENLKHVIEKIGEDIGEKSEKHNTLVLNETESTTVKNSTDKPLPTSADIANPKDIADTSKTLTILDSESLKCTDKMNQVITESEPLPPVNFTSPPLKTNEMSIPPTSPSNEVDIPEEKSPEKGNDIEPPKSSLTEVDEAVSEVDSSRVKEVCNLGTRFDSLLRVTAKETENVDGTTALENNKIILNLDTNTTTTMKPETNATVNNAEVATSSASLLPVADESKLSKASKDELSKTLSYNSENTFVPITNRTEGLHSDLSNDIFASLQVPSSSHNPESISPTAAFLMAFPLVSSLNGKTEVLDEDMKEDFKYHSQTPPMLLQIGTMEPNSFKIKTSSPSRGGIAEKRLKVACEEKKTDAVAAPTSNSETLIPVGTATKSLPKIVNDETLREPFKIVQTVLAPTLEKSVSGNSFSHTSSIYSHVETSPVTSIITNAVANDNCQLTTSVTSMTTNTETESIIGSQASASKIEVTNCTTEVSNCNTDVRYSGTQDFLPSYSTVVDTNLETLQSNAVFTNSSVAQDTSSIGIPRSAAANVSQPLPPHLGDIVTTTNSSSNISLRSLQVEYPVQMKDKDTQSTQQAVYSKNSLDPTIPSNHRLDYAGQIDRVLPTSSQSLRQDYPAQQTKDPLPILASQSMSVYDSQSKDGTIAVSHNPQQGFNAMQHEIDQSKSLPRKDSISYNAGNNGNGSRGQSYGAKDPISNSTDSHFQRSYSKLNKETDSGNSAIDQDGKLNDVLRSKPHEPQDHRRDGGFASTKKIDVDPFTQTFAYGVKESIGTQAEQNVLSTNTDGIFQGKREESQNYVSYSNKEIKKISTSTSNPMTSKSLVQNATALRYSQQQTSFVATSNYEQSTITDNHAKSTTTVAHNSSNFSILSWTTFSPVNGNNLVHFEQGSNQNDNTEAKTICENYSYIPLHKENPSFSNVLVSDAYSVSSNVAGIDKSRMKPGIETQKQPFVDPTKNRNAQSNVPPPVTKHNRIQNQNQAPPASNDYKYNAESKNKTKYGLDSEYIQNEYSGIDQQNQQQQQQQQQHTAKNHQALPSKQDKAVYPMSGYDNQVNFDLPEVSTQMKYSIETYATSNFKYADKTQQQNQHKYQPLTQGQVSSIQHSVAENVSYNSDGKHGQQQQQSSKTKTNQQQHAVRAPVNWMMTPEIKHNANIADIILPPIGKELEFCQNNLFAQTPSYNQGTPNQFYNNYDVATHSFPNLPVLQSDPKRTGEAFYSEEQPFPWSPTKSTVHNVEQSQSVKGIDQHIVPSTLPTLVGDLDLGTNIPEKQNFLFGQMPSRVLSEQSKDPIKDKEGNVNGREFHAVLNTQNVQHSVPGSSFLSVSQLVEHEKAEKSHQQHHQQQHHHHHHHPHQHQQQQQQQQARKHQRKNNTSPRGNSKRQMEIRKQTSNEQLHQRHEEQKSSSHGFSDQSYQQQKYQQNNNVHWRSRNCKSNYTAEALIGTNTSVHDTSHQEKHASIKFASNYPQNKFQSALPTADTVMPINYFSNADDGTGYGQMVNQNFNSYTYSSNANIYPTSNFITSISNTPSSYMMPLHDNADYMEANAFLLSNVAASSAATSSTTSTATTSTANVSASTNAKNHQHYGKHQNCDKRYPATVAKKTKRKGLDGTMQNIEFPLSGINSPLEDYHHSTTFLPPPPPPHANSLYQNHAQSNVYTKAVNGLPPPPPPPVAGAQGVPTVATAGFPVNPNMARGGIVSSNPMTMAHHPSGTSLTNFNLSTIFPEMNDKVTGYKPPNHIAGGLSQSSNQGSAAYAQRSNYPANPLCHLPQVSEATQFGNSIPPPPPPGVIHYKNV